MKPTYKGAVIMVVAMLLILFRSLSGSGQTTLLTESFENGGSIPAGWATEVISPNNQVTFVTSSTYPSGFTAYNGSWMPQFDSYWASGGVIRLKRILPVSTVSYSNLNVDFYWLESTGYPASNDKVEVEWSTNGTTWTTAGSFLRYNAIQGWKFKSLFLPAGAYNQPALYIAFKFTSAYGNNCYLDFAHLSGQGPPPPVTVTIGTGATPCSYPYTTGYMDARAQMLYTTADIYGVGGSAGQIQQIGFNVGISSPTLMNGFTVKMRNTSAPSIVSWITDSMTVCYAGTYSVSGTGWQMITLQTPFSYDGRNLLVEICYDNSATGTGTQVYGTSATGKIFHQYLNDPVGGGCTTTGNSPQTIRPNLRIFEQQYVGSLTGTVTNCYNSAPIAGATVTLNGTINVTTNASGVFTIVNVPAGTYPLVYSKVGFLPQNCTATIIANQMNTSPCGCMYPVPGVLAGILTNLATGDPIPGAKVQAGSTYTYSLSDGSYSLAVYPCATYPVTFSKPGFNNISTTWTFVCGTTMTLNLQMMPSLTAPPNVTAVTDTTLGETTLTWSPPQAPYEIIYDDGIEDQCFAWMNSLNICAVKFTPAAYPATVVGGSLFLCNPVSSGPPSLIPYQLTIYDDDGPGGAPGTAIETYDISPGNLGWTNFSFYLPPTITSGSFYLGRIQSGNYMVCDGLGLDTTTNSMRSWQKDEYNSGPWVPVQGNYMIRALVVGPGGTIPSSMLSYNVSRLKHGEESTPAAWTTLGSVTGITTYTDNSWPSLPPGPYRWAVQTYYSTWTPSAPAFSNIQYKNWTGDVTVYSEKCCTEMPGPINIMLSNTDTTYWATTDTTGHAYFQDVIFGDYNIWISIFGCATYNQQVTLTSDTLLNAILGSGIPYPPRQYLEVDCQSLVATWNPASAENTYFLENWSSGSFSNNSWTVTGGTNWTVATGFGNPAPSAQFSWTPQVTNYDQYLTSKTFTWVDAPQTLLKYDILLSSYSTTFLNAMAVELWDGTSWTVLEVYDNMNGNIPWTSTTLLLPTPGSNEYRIRFHAYGEDSYDINNWDIDNIVITLHDNYTGFPPPCMLGYNVYLNNVLAAFVPDTFCYIPPNQVQYGQTYTASVDAVYGYNAPPNHSFAISRQFTSCFLYPPTNFTVQPLECSAYLTWDKPQEMGGGDPPGLLGYYIYRGFTLRDSVMSPDILEYYFLDLNTFYYYFAVEAVYDLTPYGYPGQRGLSTDGGVIGLDIICGDNLPFLETWNSGTFTYSDWTFEPSQGNWDVTSATGNPSPTADFSGFGLKSNGPYDYAMTGRALDVSQWTCSNVWLDFDIKLVDFAANSTEHMTVEVLYDNTWHQVADFVNNGSFGFETKHINIDEVRGKGMKLRFRAQGENSFNILHWYIDNVHVYGVCLPATGLSWSATSEQINLNWEAPCPEVTGYNIYRTDSSGMDPYSRINTSLVTGTTYTDIPSYWTPDAVYRYYVTAITMDQTSSGVLCESGPMDSVLVGYPVAVPGLDPAVVELFPNPARQIFTVKSTLSINDIEMVNYLGKSVYARRCDLSKLERIKTGEMAAGVYFVKINTSKGIIVKKLVIQK
jgi:hypothetical protein